jgi:hypothetical protein
MRNIRSADAWLPQNQPRRRFAAAGIVFFAAGWNAARFGLCADPRFKKRCMTLA